MLLRSERCRGPTETAGEPNIIEVANEGRMERMAPSARKVSLTGIKPTGEPHLGNLIGGMTP